jgi:16S rRNA (adenine(1408)-N(1))-methyltransferase
VAAPTDNLQNQSSDSLLSLTSGYLGGGVIVDIGTGDGRFVYQCARENPDRFYLGIDANAKPLEKISMKATRKPAQGGAANLLFIQAAVENLPPELNNAADEIHVHFPWGSLLRVVMSGDQSVLKSLYRISAPGGLLEVVVGIDLKRDQAELERLGLPPLSLHYIDTQLAAKYKAAGFIVREKGSVSPAERKQLQSSWARRLSGNDRREVVYFIAEAQK